LTELPRQPVGKVGWPWTEESRQMSDTMPDGSPWPRVSIVTPSYNQAQFLEETIRSVLLQGYPDLEYIIIDGGSTDESVDIIRKYESWLAHWVSEPDRGQSQAINKGWKRSTGQFLAWLNSDDLLLTGTVERAAQSLVRSPAAGLVHGVCEFIDGASEVVGRMTTIPFSWDHQLFANRIAQQTVFLRREALEAAGYLDEALHYVMDYDLWLRVALTSQTQYLDVPQAQLRCWEGSKTTQYPASFCLEWLGVLDRFFKAADLPPGAVAMKERAYGRLHWQGGIRLVEARRAEDALEHMERAIVDYDLLDLDPDFALREILYVTARLRPAGRLDRLLNVLPDEQKGVRAFKRRVWGQFHGIRCFEGRRGDRPAVVRQHWFRALRWQPSWLRNRGFLRLVQWAYLDSGQG
jgi:glycosyltransferase involved in cell wall biosynthesis